MDNEIKKHLENINNAFANIKQQQQQRKNVKFNGKKHKRIYNREVLSAIENNIRNNGIHDKDKKLFFIRVTRNEIENILNMKFPENLQYALQKELKNEKSNIVVNANVVKNKDKKIISELFQMSIKE